MRRFGRGFTALELILTLALFGVVVGIVAIPLVSLQTRNAVADASARIVDTLRRAETQALSGHFGDRWGVHFSDGDGCALPATRFHLFRGTSYTSATDTTDAFDVPGGAAITALSLGGGCDVTFSRFQGTATPAGTITVTSVNGQSKIITVNGYGRVVEQ
jgi:prepilin-type N-terminal cleavage/methylation domain-containing protein